jgi:hypothetical protein
VLFGEPLHEPRVILTRRTPHRDGAAQQRGRGIRHHEFRVNFHARAESVAFRAGTEGCVETECPWFQFIDRQGMVVGAGKLF